jgi:hypothetical protein
MKDNMRNKIPPILFIVFNRLDTTRQVFEAIRQAKPAQLFVAADGPRTNKEGEAEKCDAVRKYVLDHIDWECDLQTRFQETNLGCGEGPSSAISWFFDHVEEGIILEDDCLPHPDFFEYCSELLEKYKNNNQIAIISGYNLQAGRKHGSGSYYFSKYVGIWGWATWKRVWNGYQFDLNLLDKDWMWQRIDDLFKTQKERKYWKSIFETMANRLIDTWDYQLCFHIWYNTMSSITPNVSLVKNIGFGEGATHTLDPNTKAALVELSPIIPLVHPSQIKISEKADDYLFKTLYMPPESILSRVRKKRVILYKKIKKIITS